MDDDPAKHDASDDELLKAIQKGSEEASAELFRKHDRALSVTIIEFLASKGCNNPREHAAGTKSKTWIAVIRELGALRDVNKFDPWMLSIAKSMARNHLMECIRDQKTFVEPKEEPAADFGMATENAEFAAKILEQAEGISPQLARVISLRHLEGLSWNEIADQLKENKETIRSIYYRGIAELRRRLEALITESPVEDLSDKEVLALTELRLTDEQQAALYDLLARNREGALDAEGQKQLDELIRLYEHGLLRKSQALRVAVQRELIEPLQP